MLTWYTLAPLRVMDPGAGVVVGGWPDVWRDVDAADRYTNEQPASLAGADLSEQITVGVSLGADLRLRW